MTKKVIFHIICLYFTVWAWAGNAAPQQTIEIAFLTQEARSPANPSNLDPIITEKGLPGAELAIIDDNTTGQFTHQHFALKKFTVPLAGKVEDVFNRDIANKFQWVVTVLPSEILLPLADLPAAQTMVFFDAATSDDRLRGEQCRRNVLHLLPSRTMRAHALAQYMTKKRWRKWFLVIGDTPEDRLLAEAYKQAAKRYQMDIVNDKAWSHTFEARRTAQADVAVFSQTDEDYDVLVVADEQGLFGDYLEYRTWQPRPVIGTQGLAAKAWHPAHDQWGATQLQNRFQAHAHRWMTEEDYGAYLAVRALGEAATRTQANTLAAIQPYLLGDKFALQGYKGTPLSFRNWDGQLRQPVLLAASRSLVAVAPIEGFLHPKTELDTLGYDQPESECHWKN